MGLQATRGSVRSLRPFMFCTAVSTSLGGVWGQQLLPKCIRAKACQPALPAHSKGQSVSGGAPVGECQGEAGGRVARLELPDTGTRLTAGSNWLPSESLPLPPPD